IATVEAAGDDAGDAADDDKAPAPAPAPESESAPAPEKSPEKSPEPAEKDDTPKAPQPAPAPARRGPENPPVETGAAARPGDPPYASPAVRAFARELGVDIRQVQGTGRKNRITREDVQGYVKHA